MKGLINDAGHGDPYACLALAYYRQTGKEMEPDMDDAIAWYTRAADLGCARAHWELFAMTVAGETGFGPDEALRHLTISADLGNVSALVELATQYVKGGGLVDRDEERGFELFRRAAEQGFPLAKFSVGRMYATGSGVERSASEAEMWYSSTALTGDAELFLDIGLSFEYGLNGLDASPIEAARWYKYGVDMGYDKCILCWNSVLGTLDGGEQEPWEGRMARLAETSSQRGLEEREGALMEADTLLGEGREEEAYEAYTRAAELGSPQAMFARAMMRHQGIGVKRDDLDAIGMLSRAADAGSEDAQFYLARTYESNRFPTDESQIIRLYSDAASNGFLAAYYYLSKYVDHPEVYVRRTHMRHRGCRSRRSSRRPRTGIPMRRLRWDTCSSAGTGSARTAGRRPGGSASPRTRATPRPCATSPTSRRTDTASAATWRVRWSYTAGRRSWAILRPCSTWRSCTRTSRASLRIGSRPAYGTGGRPRPAATPRCTGSA